MTPVQDSQPAVPPAPPPAETPEPLQPEPAEAAPVDQAEPALPGVAAEPGSPPPRAPGSPSAGLVAVGILIGLCLVGGVLVMMVRRRLLHGEDEMGGTVSLMESLRGMLRRGEITQAEFDAAKRSMVTRITDKAKTGTGVHGQAGDGTGS